MVDLSEIHSLSDFQRNAREFIGRLKRSGKPVVLTVNGKAEVVVQDAASYQKLLEAIDQAEALVRIQRGLESMKRKEGKPAVEFLEKAREKHNIPRRARKP